MPSSTRRLLPTLTSVLASAFVAAPATADTTTWSRSTAYVCASLGDGSTYPVDLAVRLRAPTSAAPGGTVSAEGTATTTFSSGPPGIVGALSLSRTVRLRLDRLRLPVRVPTVGGVLERTVDLGDLTSEPAPVPAPGAPLALPAPLRIPEIVLPQDATDDVQIAMPVDGSAAGTVGSGPPEVAFTGTLLYAGGLPTTLPVSCRLTVDRRDVVARVPVDEAAEQAAGPASTAASPSSAPARTPRRTTRATRTTPATEGTRRSSSTGAPATAARGVVSTAGVAPAPGRRSAASAAADRGSASPTADPEAVASGSADVPWEPVPAATRGTGVVVPVWVLAALLGIGLAAASVFAVRDHRRLRAAAHRLRRTS